LNDADLRAFVEARAVQARLVYPSVPTPTVPDAALALGVPASSIVKSLVFLAAGAPHLIVAAGEARVRMPALALALGVSRKRLKLASPEEALELTGYPVGAMPPFGHRALLPTLADARSLNPDDQPPERVILYGGGGTHSALLELSLATLLAVTGARLAPLTDDPSPDASLVP
jgi:prolyl-tRNA editing enzyme YbaK/EbsC (Cys-tRNA(Pro) deacylase)